MSVIPKSITLGFIIGLVLGLSLSAFIYFSIRARIKTEHIEPDMAAGLLCSADMASFYAPVLISFWGSMVGGVTGMGIIGYRYLSRRNTRFA